METSRKSKGDGPKKRKTREKSGQGGETNAKERKSKVPNPVRPSVVMSATELNQTSSRDQLELRKSVSEVEIRSSPSAEALAQQAAQQTQRIKRMSRSLGPTQRNAAIESCVFPLRGYHSEPNLLTLTEPEFQDVRIPRKGQVGRSKTMEDVVLSSLCYPSLVTEAIYPGDTDRTYVVSESVRNAWEAVAQQEINRFSFYDALFAGGFVVDSLEVPARLDDISYLIEGDVSVYRDKPLDYARMVFKSKTVFTGNLTNGHFSGPGRYIWLDGTIYQGDFQDGLMHGEGVLLLPDGCFFEGEFKNGERTGWGIYTTPTGLMYAGEWLKGVPNGNGKVWYNPNVEDSDYYDGQWDKGTMHGFGTRQYINGSRYIGNFHRGTRKGQGTMIWLAERQVYKGEWAEGEPNGFGEHVWYFPRSATCPYPQRNVYKGDFVNGMRHGIGRMIYACGSIYDGKWHDGVKHGKGIFINPAGEVLFAIFRQGSISGGSDIPLHVPTYACKFRSLVTVLQQRLHVADPTVAQLEEEYLSETVTRFLTRVRSLYKRAGYLGEWWGNQGHFPQWMKKSTQTKHHLQHRHTKDPILESIQSQIYESDEQHASWTHGHKPHFGSPDHVNPVTRFGLWLLLKDCPGVLSDITLAELDSIWTTIPSISFQTRHHPFEPVQLWQFLQCLVVVASMIYIEIPKRNYQYEMNVEEDEEAFEAEVEHKVDHSEEEEETEVDDQIMVPPPPSPAGSFSSTKNSKTSDSGAGSAKDNQRKKSSRKSKMSKTDSKTRKSQAEKRPTVSAGGAKKGRASSKARKSRNSSPKQSVDTKIRKDEASASTQTEMRYGVPKEADEAQTDLKYDGDEVVRDFMLSEAFELFLTDFLLPCLERRPGKHLPQAPNPLPSLSDLYAAFNVVSPYKDVISAREFLISTLPHRQIPDPTYIYWTRSKNVITPDIDMPQFFKHFAEPDTPQATDLLDYDFLSEKLSNADMLIEDIKTEVFGSEQTQNEKEEKRHSSIKIFGSGNIVFGDDVPASSSATSQHADEGQGDAAKPKRLPSESDFDLPLAESDLTAVPFLWETDPVCKQVPKSTKVFDNIELSDVLKILRQFYPRTCGDRSTMINLEFNLTFGDWVWLTLIINKLSTDRAFCAWMKNESGLEHKPGRCRQSTGLPEAKETEAYTVTKT